MGVMPPPRLGGGEGSLAKLTSVADTAFLGHTSLVVPVRGHSLGPLIKCVESPQRGKLHDLARAILAPSVRSLPDTIPANTFFLVCTHTDVLPRVCHEALLPTVSPKHGISNSFI